MKRRIHQYVISFLFLFTMGCDRLKVDSSKISLQVPKNLSGKMNSSSATLSLKHLAVQVTASDMSHPVILLQDAGDSSSLGSEITLEIPSGSNRLVQVLAAYAPAGSDDGAILYYGDVSKSLTGTTETLDVPLQKLGSENTVEGRLHGRYLTAVNAGPSGELKLFYRPTGKPALLVDRKMMFGGWFEMVAFSDIPMDYVLPDGSYMGEQWTTNTLPTGPHLIKVIEPSSFRDRWTSAGSSTWEPRSPENKFYGFFAKNSSYLANKTVCVQSSLSNGGTLYSSSHFVTESRNHLMPIKHFAAGTTPTTTPQAIAFVGGRTFAECASLPAAEEFVSYLKFNGTNWDNRIYDIGENFGIIGLQTMFTRLGENPVNRTSDKFGLDAGGAYVEIRPLPGALEGFNGLQIYENSSTSSSVYTDSCEPSRLINLGWTLHSSAPLPVATNGNLKIYLKTLGWKPQRDFQYQICLSKDGQPYGKATYVWADSADIAPPNTLSINTSSTSGAPFHSSPVSGECRPVSINLSGPTMPVNPFPSLGYSVAATDGAATPAAILYSSKDCTGTPAISISKTFAPQVTDSTIYMKSASPGSFSLAVTNASGLTNPAPLYVNVMDTTNTPNSVALALDMATSPIGNFPTLTGVYPQGCHPVVAFFSEGGRIVNNSGSATFSWTELDGTTTYTPPSDIKIVDNCISKSPQSSINVVNGVGRFAVTAGTSLLANISLTVAGFGALGKTDVNIGPIAHHLSLTLPAGSSTSPVVYQCQAVKVEARDATGNLVTVPTNKKIRFSLQARSEVMEQPTSVSFYSDSSCMIQQHEYDVVSGTSSTLVYMKTNDLGVFFVGYSSQFTQNYGSMDSEIRMTPLPAPLSVDLGGYSNIPNTVYHGFGIFGGTPPYTATVTQGAAVVNVAQPYPPLWQLQLTPSATGPLTIQVIDSKGQTTQVNLTVY
ncbi:hypothetical protein [Bdellovibrio bacteriovorus]|uniref:hypothetical protein n=1 Tax=Bdellovibrio bacteriovorus TaxID=959 RepID=UPI0035A6EA23